MTGGGAAPRKGLNLNELRLKRVYNDKGFLFSLTCILLLVDLKFWSGSPVRPNLRYLKHKLFPNKGLCPFLFRQSKRNVFFSYKFHRLEFRLTRLRLVARIAHGFIRLLLLAPAFFSSFFLVVGPRLGAKSVFPSGFFRNPRSKITNSTDTALSFDDVLHVQLYHSKERMQILFSLFSYKAAEFCLCRKSLILNELRRAAGRLAVRLWASTTYDHFENRSLPLRQRRTSSITQGRESSPSKWAAKAPRRAQASLGDLENQV